jgi:ankyrin repeat protein
MDELWIRTFTSFMFKVKGKSAMETAVADVMAYWARKLNAQKIKVILDCTGVDVNTKPSRGFTALQWAVLENSPETVSFLLRAGAKQTEVIDLVMDPDDETKECGRHVLGLLLAAGALLEEDDDLHEVFLLDSLTHGDFAAAALLLAAGASLECALRRHVDDIPMLCALGKHRKIAAKELELVGFGEVRERLLEICVGLHDADLPTPILTLIVEFACEPFASRLPYHYLWDSVVTIRHFRVRRHAPAPQHADRLANCRRNQDQFLAREKEALGEKNNRALEMLTREDFAGATPLLRELLEVLRTALDERCTCTLVTKFNLAWALFHTGCLEEAKALYLDILQPDDYAYHNDNARLSILTRARQRLRIVEAEISKRH